MQSSASQDKPYTDFLAAQAEAVSATDRYREGRLDARAVLEATDRAVRQLKLWLGDPIHHTTTELGRN